jgi:hypothetical protein
MAVPLADHPRGEFTFRTNNLGLRRDTPSSIEKPKGTRRILVLGDSQTDGYVDNPETFAALLESALATSPGTAAVEVFNAGVVGYSPAQEYLWYQQRGSVLRPDVVVLVVYPGNDLVELRDASKPSIDRVTGEIRAPRERGGPAGPGRFAGDSLADRSRIVALGRYAVRQGPLARLWIRFGLPGALDQIGGFPVQTLIDVLRACHGCFWQSQHQAVFARRDPEGLREQVEAVARMVARMAGEVAARGSALRVAVLPSRMQVEPALAAPEAARTARLLGLEEEDLAAADGTSRALLDALAAAGVSVLSLEDRLRAAARDGPTYYSRDWHLNVRGHRVVADALADEPWSRSGSLRELFRTAANADPPGHRGVAAGR